MYYEGSLPNNYVSDLRISLESLSEKADVEEWVLKLSIYHYEDTASVSSRSSLSKKKKEMSQFSGKCLWGLLQ